MLFFIVRLGLGAIRNLIFLTLFSIVKKSIPPDLQEQLKTLKAFGGRRKAVRDRLALQGGTGDFP